MSQYTFSPILKHPSAVNTANQPARDVSVSTIGAWLEALHAGFVRIVEDPIVDSCNGLGVNRRGEI